MLAVKDLHLSFGGVQAMRGVSFVAPTGQITGVIGPNGAGKTSLLNAISGFYRPDRGTVHLAGQDITLLRPDRRAALGLARTFQNIALFHGMSVLDNIKLGAHCRLKTGVVQAMLRFGPARAEEIALRAEIEEEVISVLDLAPFRTAPISALPYGLQKRVELARALAMRPRLLLLDEPVAGMDAAEVEDTARLILRIRETLGTTILLVEHDMQLVMGICAQVVVLNFGRQIASGTPAQVRGDPAVISAYLGAAA